MLLCVWLNFHQSNPFIFAIRASTWYCWHFHCHCHRLWLLLFVSVWTYTRRWSKSHYSYLIQKFNFSDKQRFFFTSILYSKLVIMYVVHLHTHTHTHNHTKCTGMYIGVKKETQLTQFPSNSVTFFVTCLILICSFYSCFPLYHRIFRSGTGSDGKFHLLPTGELLIHNLGEYQ